MCVRTFYRSVWRSSFFLLSCFFFIRSRADNQHFSLDLRKLRRVSWCFGRLPLPVDRAHSTPKYCFDNLVFWVFPSGSSSSNWMLCAQVHQLPEIIYPNITENEGWRIKDMRKIAKDIDREWQKKNVIPEITPNNQKPTQSKCAILAQINANFLSIVKCVTILIWVLLFKCFEMELNFGAADFLMLFCAFPIVIMLRLQERKHGAVVCVYKWLNAYCYWTQKLALILGRFFFTLKHSQQTKKIIRILFSLENVGLFAK